MAITYKRTNYPSLIPAFNDAYIYFESSLLSNANFRYVIDIQNANASIITTYKRLPRPVDNFAEVNISKVLQSLLSTSFNPYLIDSDGITDQWKQYRFRCGEQFQYQWTFDDYYFENSFPGGDTGLTSSVAHQFSVGDIITISLDSVYNDNRDLLNGTFVVIGVPSVNNIAINITGIGSGPATPGKVLYADNEPIEIGASFNSGTLDTFYGAIPFNVYNEYNEELYMLNGNELSNLLTTIPDYFEIQKDNILQLNVFDSFTNVNKYVVFNMSNGIKYRYMIDITQGIKMRRINAVPSDDNIEEIWNGSSWTTFVGSVELVDYNITIENISGIKYTNPKFIKVKDNCSFSDTATLYFVDRLGSYIPFNFKKYNTNQNITKEESRLKYSDINLGGIWSYDETESGLVNNNINEQLTISLTTYRLKDLTMFRELMTSGDVYIKTDIHEYRKVIITDINTSLPTRRNIKNIVKTVNIKFANDDNINNI